MLVFLAFFTEGASYPIVFPLRRLDVFWDIDEHRPLPPVVGDLKGLLDRPLEILNIPHHEIVLHDGLGDPHDIHLLEGVLPQAADCHVSCDGYHGH